jgi:hypothetical protein
MRNSEAMASLSYGFAGLTRPDESIDSLYVALCQKNKLWFRFLIYSLLNEAMILKMASTAAL